MTHGKPFFSLLFQGFSSCQLTFWRVVNSYNHLEENTINSFKLEVIYRALFKVHSSIVCTDKTRKMLNTSRPSLVMSQCLVFKLQNVFVTFTSGALTGRYFFWYSWSTTLSLLTAKQRNCFVLNNIIDSVKVSLITVNSAGSLVLMLLNGKNNRH